MRGKSVAWESGKKIKGNYIIQSYKNLYSQDFGHVLPSMRGKSKAVGQDW